MKTYYRNKILINGMFPMRNFNIDGYTEKTAKYKKALFNQNNEDSIFYISGYLIQSSYSLEETGEIYYEYFENDELIEVDVEENIYNNNRKLQEYYLNILSKKVSFLQAKLRLITGITIGLPAFNVKIYDENKKIKTKVGMFVNQSSCLKIWDYNTYIKRILERRLRIDIHEEVLISLEKKNNRFKRAFTFYTQSFLPEDRNVRFILLFSSLESLFNMDGKKIKKTISKFTSKIHFLDNIKEEKMKIELENLYSKRSFYIHGNTPKEISKEQEIYLREVVRKTLLIYLNISINMSIENPKAINLYIQKHNKSNLEQSIRTFVDSLDEVNINEFIKCRD